MCKRIRRHHPSSELGLIVVASAPGGRCSDCALPHGGDWCVRTNPLDAGHFLRSVAAVVGKIQNRASDRLQRGPLTLVSGGAWIRVHGRKIQLPATAFAILWRLAAKPGRVLGPHDLGDDMGHPSPEEAASSLRVQISRLRRYLGSDRDLVETVRGKGYRLNLEWRSG